jgi:alpha-tubulin suppressor-like RCC1 family protein
MGRLRAGRIHARRRWIFAGHALLSLIAIGLIWTAVAPALTLPTLTLQAQPTLASGGGHTLVIKADGTLWATGVNSDGQWGDGTTKGGFGGKQVGTETGWVTVAGGANYSLGIKTDGSLWAWGGNAFGQLGDGSTISRLVPTRIGSDTGWVAVSACKVTASRKVGDIYVPVGMHTAGVKADGSLWAWGANGDGQLGDGTTTGRLAPTRVGTDSDWVAVAAGETHCLALKTDGSLWAWGHNASGELGDSTSTARLVPTRVGTDNDWVSIAAGGGHSHAIKSDGSLWSWGVNYNGTLGDGTKTGRRVPTRVGTEDTWTAVDAASFYCLALKSDGSMWNWGVLNWANPATTAPVRFETATDWVAVSCGESPRTALRSGGSVYWWQVGSNQLMFSDNYFTGVRMPGYRTATPTPTTTTTTSAPSVTFSDVPASSPYYAAIASMASKAIIGGYPDGTFGPDKLVLRKHFAKMIVGAMGLTTTEADWQDASPPFTDCGPDDPNSLYPHDYIAVAKAHNLTAGKTATTFAPEANITRAQMVTMVVRAAQNSGIALTPLGSDYDGTYQTYDDPNHGGNVHLADANGLLAGLAVTGDPAAWMAGNATRGEVAQVLWNLMKLNGGGG